MVLTGFVCAAVAGACAGFIAYHSVQPRAGDEYGFFPVVGVATFYAATFVGSIGFVAGLVWGSFGWSKFVEPLFAPSGSYKEAHH
jgi:hypothetical protein